MWAPRGRHQASPYKALPQSLPFEKLHDNEGLTVVLSDFVDGTNVGMIQSGSRPRFALEPLQGHSICGQSIGQELQRDVAPQGKVFGPVDHTHAPATQLFQDSVMGNGLPQHGRLLAFWESRVHRFGENGYPVKNVDAPTKSPRETRGTALLK